jgi:Tetratricopeptide repeat
MEESWVYFDPLTALSVDLELMACYSATATSRGFVHNCPFNLSFEMSAVTKGLRRSTSRAVARRASPKPAAKRRVAAPKTTRPKAKRAPAKKTATRKIAKAKVSFKTKVSLKSKRTKKAAKVVVRKKAAPKQKAAKKAITRKAVPRKSVVAKHKKAVSPSVRKTQKLAAVRAPRPSPVAQAVPRQPTVDEAAALKAFERAHKEFTRGRFGEARNQFRALLDKYFQVSEVAARARTYLAVSDARLRTESILPRDADSLYDRGVIELNRGEYVAAQEMFERALKREPEAAHIHYGLAATRARLGSLDLALQSLQRALDLQPTLRVRAQHDHDLTSLRNDPDFDRLVFQPRL